MVVHTLSDVVVETLSKRVFSIKNLLSVVLHNVFLYFVITKTYKDRIIDIFDIIFINTFAKFVLT